MLRRLCMVIESFFDERTWTLTYVVWDKKTRDAVIIDPVLDYEPNSSKIWTESVDEVIRFVKTNDLTIHYILETHAHADHISDRKSTRLNSSHVAISYAVCCLK